MRKELPVDPNEQVIRIYAEFKWKLRIADQTFDTIAKHLDEAIVRCEKEISDEAVRDKAVQMFENMRSRTSEFTSDASSDDAT